MIKSTETPLSEEEILRQQKERDAELSKIVGKYIIERQYKDFKYKIYCEKEPEAVGLRKIKIYKGGRFLQKIDIPKDSAYIYHDDEFNFSADEDWNFDGFPDMETYKISWNG